MNLSGGSKTKFVFQSHIDKNNAVALSDTEKRTIGKTDNVKTSPDRQVKAQTSRTFFWSSLLFLVFALRNMNAAEGPS